MSGRRTKARRAKRKNNKKKVILITTLGLLLFLMLFSVIFSIINIGNDKIVKGVKIEKIDISKLTRRTSKRKDRKLV